MTSSDNESQLSGVPSQSTQPGSIASSGSSAIAKRTRNRATRRPIVTAKRLAKPSPLGQSSQTVLPFQALAQTKCQDNAETETEPHDRSSDDLDVESDHVSQPTRSSQVSTRGIESNISSETPLASHLSIKRARSKTSAIHQHAEVKQIASKGDCYVCNYCSKAFELGGGTGGISRHLKRIHHIDPKASSIAQKRQREGTAIDAVIL